MAIAATLLGLASRLDIMAGAGEGVPEDASSGVRRASGALPPSNSKAALAHRTPYQRCEEPCQRAR